MRCMIPRRFMRKPPHWSPSLNGEQMLGLARALIVYYAFLLRRIRDLLPFYELSVAFEGQKIIAERVALSPMGKGVD